jgi:aryl-alcohol dehydrogenase-like predicted oxidoreductase
MKFRILGKTGFKVSEIGFGAWAIGGNTPGHPHWGNQSDKDSIDALHIAIDNGINFIETARGYGFGKSEQLIGQVLKERKERIYVATKTPPNEGKWPPSPYDKAEDRFPEKYLREDVEDRLNKLGVDCLDILMIHTWTRAWNKDPKPLIFLDKLRKEGKIRFIGVSTPEQDQNSLIDLMKNGFVDVISLIFNIFEQEPAAEMLSVAKEYNVGVIDRVVFDEGSLTGKYTEDTKFEEGDVRNNYFKGDKLKWTMKKIEKIKEDVKDSGLTMAQIAVKFALNQAAINTVIPGIRNTWQAKENAGMSDLPPLSKELVEKLQKRYWVNNLGRYYIGSPAPFEED